VLAALWFTVIQAVILDSFCPYCLVAHASGGLAGVLCLWQAPVRPRPEKPWQREKEVYVSPRGAWGMGAVAVAGLGLLLAGQTLYRPPVQVLQLPGGVMRLDLRKVPVWGNPDAPHRIVSLFDYTCHYCRTMHSYLRQVFRDFSNDLAIVSLPMPLSSACNPVIRRTPRAHRLACEYARIGLAVWRARPEAMLAFDDWVFEPEHPPPLPQTRARAQALVGAEAFEAALKDPWVDRLLQRSTSIYGTNLFFGYGSMPQVIIGTNIITSTLGAPASIYRELERQFGLKRDKS